MQHEIESHDLEMLTKGFTDSQIEPFGPKYFDSKGREVIMISVNAELEYDVEDNSFDYAGTHCTHGQSGTHDPGGSIEVQSCAVTAMYDKEGETVNLKDDCFKPIIKSVEEALSDEYQNGKGAEYLLDNLPAPEPPEPDYDDYDDYEDYGPYYDGT